MAPDYTLFTRMINSVMDKISVSRVAFLTAIILTPAATLTSQPTNQVVRTPQFENSEVTVWKTLVPPNAPPMMHTHDHPRVIVALTGGEMKTVYENGPTVTHQWETGKAYWQLTEQRRHSDANTTDKPIEVMVVELKNAKN